MRLGLTEAVAVVLLGCGGGRDPEAVAVTIHAVSPADGVLLPEIFSADILFSATRSGQFRMISSDLPGSEQLLVEPDGYDAGTLRSARVGRAALSPGGNLVSIVLQPADGSNEARAQAQLVVFESSVDAGSSDGGSGADGGVDRCEAGCASEAEDPVCGSDGNTYQNRCLLECAEVFVAYHDTCERCLNCSGEDGFPSCGVDGCIYLNACKRECAGVAESVSPLHCVGDPCQGG